MDTNAAPSLGNLSAGSLSTQRLPQHEETCVIPVTFHIGSSGLLEGTPEDVRASLEEAGVNFKWRRKPYFDLELAEQCQVGATLAAISGSLDCALRTSRAKALDRMHQLKAIKPKLILGLQLLIYYQRIFFPNEDLRVENLSAAISSYSLLCLDPANEATHFGGPLEAFPIASVDRIRIRKIQFGLPDAVVTKELLGAQGGAQTKSWLWLAANNQLLSKISQSELAIHFIPLLVRAIVNSGELGDDVVDASSDDLAWLCSMQSWVVGVH